MDDLETRHRRARLRELIDVGFDQKLVNLLRFIEQRTGTAPNQGELSALKRENSGKSFGDKKARTLTEQIGLDRRWFDEPMGSGLERFRSDAMTYETIAAASVPSEESLNERRVGERLTPYRRDVTPIELHLEAAADRLQLVQSGKMGLARYALPNDRTQAVLITGGGLSPRVEHRELLIVELVEFSPAVGDTVLVCGPSREDYALGRVRSYFAAELEIDPMQGGRPVAIRGEHLYYYTLKAILMRGANVTPV
ncbi:MAG: hypothetical protein JWN23_612 [Rhodocyclales bacterium]|nr:hypothetical protein [Rhodocyclales bacterium]